MPSLYHGVCYPSVEAAQAAACSAASLTWGEGSSVHTLECTSSTGPTMALCKRTDGSACTLVDQPWPTFPECDHAGGTDLALDWMYAALLLFVMLYGLKRLIALFSGTDEK